MLMRVVGVCPALCSGNGVYESGRCKCHQGWTGDECQVPSEDCAGVYCSQHGRCVDGRCVCSAGFSGVDCFQGASYSSLSLLLLAADVTPKITCSRCFV